MKGSLFPAIRHTMTERAPARVDVEMWRVVHGSYGMGSGSDRRRSWAAVTRSMILIGPPHRGQLQTPGAGSGAGTGSTLDPSGAALGSIGAPSNWKQTGNNPARRRLARKPKWRMRTKPFGSRCSRKRRRNSSTGRVMRRFLFLCAESRQRNVT